jgi:hypothetical protein
MRHEIAFPMYDLHRPDTLALIRAVSERLAAKDYRQRGLAARGTAFPLAK